VATLREHSEALISAETWINDEQINHKGCITWRIGYNNGLYRVFREQADWIFILPPELPAKELHHLPRKMPQRGTTY
jgi:hypothetical protein